MATQVEWVKQSVTGTPGTGAITLGSAQVGFIRFQDDTRVTNGTLVHYTVQDGNDRERGIGTYNSGVLARTVVQAKLQAGVYSELPIAPLSLTSSAVVSCSSISQGIRGASVKRTNSQSIPHNTTTNIIWQVADFDTNSFFNPSTNPDRLTVTNPDINMVKIEAAYRFESEFIGDINFYVAKNNQVFFGGTLTTNSSQASRYPGDCIVTPPVSVALNDFFTCKISQTSGGTHLLGGAGAATSDLLTWCSIQVFN